MFIEYHISSNGGVASQERGEKKPPIKRAALNDSRGKGL